MSLRWDDHLRLKTPLRPGHALELVPGVYCLTTSLPFRLRAINLWLLRDGDGWTMVDCGFPTEQVRAEIEDGWSRVLQGKPITRLIVTHHHPDHVGNCRWICDRWGIGPTITDLEYEKAQYFWGGQWRERLSHRAAFWQRHGLPRAEALTILEGWTGNVTRIVPANGRHGIRQGDGVTTGDYEWQAIVAQGHSPEQLLLYSRRQNLLIAGDQVLDKITPNVSVQAEEPEADPLALFLASNRRLAETCGDAIVLPSHKQPFRGLRARIEAIAEHHEARLEKIEAELRKGPKTAAALLPALFGNPASLTPHEIGFAIGEAIAHLHYLAGQQRAQSIEAQGSIIFTAP